MVVTPRATLFGYPWMDTLAHEYTHLVVSRMSHDKVPVWLQEGLARFEQTRWRRPPEARSPATEHLLATALKKGRLITFDEMHPSMAKLPSQEAAALAFAEVYTLVGWMHDEGRLRRASATRSTAQTRRQERAPGGRRGRGTPWAGSRRSGTPPQERSTCRGRQRRARGKPHQLRQGRRRPRERRRSSRSSARARKHARLGGMLRARGMLEAAAVEYEKALAAGGPIRSSLASWRGPYVELGELRPGDRAGHAAGRGRR